MGRRNGGWLRVVGFFCLCVVSGVVIFPICGRSSIRALWSPYSGLWVVIFVFLFVLCVVVFSPLRSQWSVAVFAGIYVCMLLGVMCCSPDSLQNWCSGAWYDLWSFSVGVAWKYPPISVVTVGYLDMISLFIHVSISM